MPLHYNQAMTLLWGNFYEVSLVASGRVSSLASDVTEMMTELASKLYEPPGFNKKRERMINEMRKDLNRENFDN